MVAVLWENNEVRPGLENRDKEIYSYIRTTRKRVKEENENILL